MTTCVIVRGPNKSRYQPCRCRSAQINLGTNQQTPSCPICINIFTPIFYNSQSLTSLDKPQMLDEYQNLQSALEYTSQIELVPTHVKLVQSVAPYAMVV